MPVYRYYNRNGFSPKHYGADLVTKLGFGKDKKGTIIYYNESA